MLNKNEKNTNVDTDKTKSYFRLRFNVEHYYSFEKIVRRGFTFKVQKYKVFNEKMKQNNINSII